MTLRKKKGALCLGQRESLEWELQRVGVGCVEETCSYRRREKEYAREQVGRCRAIAKLSF